LKVNAETKNPISSVAIPLPLLNISFAFYSGASLYPQLNIGLPNDPSGFLKLINKIILELGDCFFYFPDLADNNSSSGSAPGKRCSVRLYNDCMVNVHVDDKTPPVCEKPSDIFYYCDGVNSLEDSYYEYAANACDSRATPWPDYTCLYKDGEPYGNVENKKENDGDLSDTLDGTGVKSFGWYGCNVYGPAHQDEHGGYVSPCPTGYSRHRDISGNQVADNTSESKYGSNSYAPIYCHTWLTLDKFDNAGKKATPKFWTPVLRSGGRGANVGVDSFIIWDNCWIGTATTEDASYVDQCGNGWLSRTWKVGDKCGATIISCTQKIYTKHRSDFEVMFPQDVTQYCTNGDNNLGPDVTGRPMIMDDDCELVGVNYTDVRYDIIPDACYKIVRTWTLIDWCKYDPNKSNRDGEVIVDDRFVADPTSRYCTYRKLKDEGDGYMTYTQIIKVKDTVPPTISCKSDTLCVVTGYDGKGAEDFSKCTPPSYSKSFAAHDNCTPDNLIQYRYEVWKGTTLIRKSGPNQGSVYNAATGDLVGDGLYTIRGIASDKCGQEDTAECTVLIKDCKKPTPYCYNGIATVIMPTTGTVTVWAKDLDAGSYDNCTAKADLKLEISLADGTSAASRTFSCSELTGGSFQADVKIYVTDKAGNTDYCSTYLLIQSNDPKCGASPSAAGAIAGKVATESTEPVENVVLESKSTSNAPSFKTNATGSYSFNGLPMKSDYTITPKRDDDPTNGVSTIDLVLIQKHILGVQPLNSAYKVIAADVDRSSDVSAVDLVELRKLILTVYDKLPNNTSWRFVPKSYNFSNIGNPWGFPEKIDITGLSKDELNKDFVGIKVGDVNGTVVPHSLLGAEARDAAGTLKFKTEDRVLKAGEEAVVEFTSENFRNIEGYQFSLAVNGLELKAVNAGLLKVTEGNFGVTKLGNGYVTTSWNESKGISAGSNDVLFSIKVKATKAVTLSQSLVINSKYTRAEAYNGAASLGVALEVGSSKSISGYALHQNTPNPFKASTVISYDLAKADKVTLKITDVTGRTVRVYNQNGQKGYNQMTVNRADVSGAGVLYYTIETKDYSATKKMILVD
jgi:hypothetical protein